MNRVLDRLWIGSAHDFGAPLRALGFSAVLDLRDGDHALPDVTEIHKLANRDGDPWTKEQVVVALDFVASRIRSGRVLVACAAGMSRSASMTIGYLVRVGFDEVTAFMLVREARPEIMPVKKMLDSVLQAVRG